MKPLLLPLLPLLPLPCAFSACATHGSILVGGNDSNSTCTCASIRENPARNKRCSHLWLGVSQTLVTSIPSPAIQIQPIYATTILGLCQRNLGQYLEAELQRINWQSVLSCEILENGGKKRLREKEPGKPSNNGRSRFNPG
jgi:hypothetical protein